MTLEIQTERTFAANVRRAGGETYKITPVHAGIPDRLVLLPRGRIYLVELKRERGGVVSPIQQAWHARAAELGTRVVVLSGTEECTAWLAERLRDCRWCNEPRDACDRREKSCCDECVMEDGHDAVQGP